MEPSREIQSGFVGEMNKASSLLGTEGRTAPEEDPPREKLFQIKKMHEILPYIGQAISHCTVLSHTKEGRWMCLNYFIGISKQVHAELHVFFQKLRFWFFLEKIFPHEAAPCLFSGLPQRWSSPGGSVGPASLKD